MEVYIDTLEFLTKQKPVCVSFPFFDDLADQPKLYKLLVERSLEDFNENLLAKKCPKRFMCSTECLGRPIPAYPELEQFRDVLGPSESGLYKGKPVWFVKANLCQGCPLVQTCQSICGTMEAFLSKDRHEDGLDLDRIIAYNEVEEYDDGRIYDTPSFSDKSKVVKTRSEIPWEAVTAKQRRIVELRTLWLWDWEAIAAEVGDEPKNCWRTFKRAIRKLRRKAQRVVKRDTKKKNLTNRFMDSRMMFKEVVLMYDLNEKDLYETVIKKALGVLNEVDD